MQITALTSYVVDHALNMPSQFQGHEWNEPKQKADLKNVALLWQKFKLEFRRKI